MNGQTIGYARVSTTDQNLDRQINALNEFKPSKIFTDKITGRNTDREGLKDLIEYVREGDSIVVLSFDRLARSVKDLLELIELFQNKQVSIRFIKENLSFTSDKHNPMNTLLVTILGAIYQFEVEMIRERQLEGIQAAKAKGTQFGRSYKLSKEDMKMIRKMLSNGLSKAEICREWSISRPTLYRALNRQFSS